WPPLVRLSPAPIWIWKPAAQPAGPSRRAAGPALAAPLAAWHPQPVPPRVAGPVRPAVPPVPRRKRSIPPPAPRSEQPLRPVPPADCTPRANSLRAAAAFLVSAALASAARRPALLAPA